METDAAQLAAAINNSDSDLVSNGVLFRDIKAFALLNFSSFHISHCPRVCNQVADTIVPFGSKMVHEPQGVWPADVPTFARCLVAAHIAWHLG